MGDEEFFGNRLTVGSESYQCKENESEIIRNLACSLSSYYQTIFCLLVFIYFVCHFDQKGD